MNVVDSSGWLEFFADGENASFFAPVIANLEELVVPTISLYEVYKRVLQQRGQTDAAMAIAAMQRGQVVALAASLALDAAVVSLAERLPMADSVMLATARAYGATLWTQDDHFRGVSGVQYVPRRAPAKLSGSEAAPLVS